MENKIKSDNPIIIKLGLKWYFIILLLSFPILLKIYNHSIDYFLNIDFLEFYSGCYFFIYLSHTVFILTENNLIIRKSFIPFLFNKDFDLQEIELVTFRNETGRTLQPYFDIKLKNGKTCSRYTWASTEKGKLFLAELEKLGVKTEYYTNSIRL